jgi:hypothetical protein
MSDNTMTINDWNIVMTARLDFKERQTALIVSISLAENGYNQTLVRSRGKNHASRFTPFNLKTLSTKYGMLTVRHC